MTVVGSDPSQEPLDRELALDDSILERYARMALEFDVRPVDHILRAVDMLLAAVALLVLAPVLALCAVAVLASGRPVLYRGDRVGRAGGIFRMYKFRTLRPGAEQRLGRRLGGELDQLTESEMTWIGRRLRAAKLDELPQLYNVLRGDMSLVGPRPIRPAFFLELCHEIPAYWQRLVVRPGITGLAQLRLSRQMTWAEKLVHDLEYIADRSVGLYVAILGQTFALVMSRLARPKQPYV
jgi:lipopolysaccharide/colanic/teichoic acid biosynthesis glycosyltransferase